MANVTVTIGSNGDPSPSHININVGDTVSFHANGDDVVLCVSDEAIFGDDRYEIPEDSSLDLNVQSGAPQGDFDYLVLVGDLDANCGGGKGGDGEGGGSVGGGP